MHGVVAVVKSLRFAEEACAMGVLPEQRTVHPCALLALLLLMLLLLLLQLP
jgi:hypothetical protein